MEYGFNVSMMEANGEKFWVAKSIDLKGCIGQGDSIDAAIKELRENEQVWIEIAKEEGEQLPEQTTKTLEDEYEYSGKISLRLSKRVHRDAAEQAKKDGVSLNRYIENAIVVYSTVDFTNDLVRKKMDVVLDEFAFKAEEVRKSTFGTAYAGRYKMTSAFGNDISVNYSTRMKRA